MVKELYRYEFVTDVPAVEVEGSLVLALFAVESLHGQDQTRLDLAHHFDPERRACVIDAGTPVGRDFNKVFCGFVRREFGPDAFRVERVEDGATPSPRPAPAGA